VTTLEKVIRRAKDAQEKAGWHLGNQIFSCEKDALAAITRQKKTLKYHTVTAKVIEVKKHQTRGRPSKGDLPDGVGYKIQTEIVLDEESVTKIRAQKGRFILATNQLDEDVLPSQEILREYKAQSGTERGFKFIKDDTFQVDSVFLKTPERMEALMMIMTLCLMVYGVSE
jgi:transposase